MEWFADHKHSERSCRTCDRQVGPCTSDIGHHHQKYGDACDAFADVVNADANAYDADTSADDGDTAECWCLHIITHCPTVALLHVVRLVLSPWPEIKDDHGDEDHDHDEDGGDCVNAMIEFDEWKDDIVDCNYTSDN